MAAFERSHTDIDEIVLIADSSFYKEIRSRSILKHAKDSELLCSASKNSIPTRT